MNPSLVLKENDTTEIMSSNPDGTVSWQRVSDVRLKKVTLLPFFPSIGYTRTF